MKGLLMAMPAWLLLYNAILLLMLNLESVKSGHIKQAKNERSFDGHACVVTDL
jgi:hypothetical protein